jgi:hypothetical protein
MKGHAATSRHRGDVSFVCARSDFVPIMRIGERLDRDGRARRLDATGLLTEGVIDLQDWPLGS